MLSKINLSGFVRVLFASLALLAAGTVLAEDRWVTDEFEIMMRSGKGTGQRIIKQLKTGTRLEVISADAESGYTQVRGRSGEEGWVLSRYLRSSPTARLQLPTVQQNLQRSEEKRAELQKERDELRGEKRALEREVGELQLSLIHI